ncbi:MAG: hypothetical protein WDM78_15475 [Puia sp.]
MFVDGQLDFFELENFGIFIEFNPKFANHRFAFQVRTLFRIECHSLYYTIEIYINFKGFVFRISMNDAFQVINIITKVFILVFFINGQTSVVYFKDGDNPGS